MPREPDGERAPGSDADALVDDVSTAEVDELRALALAARDVEWETPPTTSWDAIAGELDDSPRAVRSLQPESSGSVARPVARRGAWAGLAAAAAVVAVVVGAVAVRAGRDGSSDDVVAVAQLDRLGPTGTGRAEVVERDGTRQLRIEVVDVTAGDDEYLEVWLLDPDVTRFVSLGPVRADGRYDLPASVDVAELPIVDVSVEPLDGDPTHSGASLLRGTLG